MTRSELTQRLIELEAVVESQNREIQQLRGTDTNLQGQINLINGSATSIDEVYPVGSIYITLSDINPYTVVYMWKRVS